MKNSAIRNTKAGIRPTLSYSLPGYVAAGDLYVVSMVGMPVISKESTDFPSLKVFDVPSFPSGTSKEGTTGWLKVWTRHVLQDYRGMSTHHKGTCNVLMADGSIQTLIDTNEDQFINNGFEASAEFVSSDVEVDKLKLASFYSLQSRGGK